MLLVEIPMREKEVSLCKTGLTIRSKRSKNDQNQVLLVFNEGIGFSADNFGEENW
jgi:hypothetical protein